MTDDEVELALERKAIEVEHWQPDEAQAAWNYHKAMIERAQHTRRNKMLDTTDSGNV